MRHFDLLYCYVAIRAHIYTPFCEYASYSVVCSPCSTEATNSYLYAATEATNAGVYATSDAYLYAKTAAAAA